MTKEQKEAFEAVEKINEEIYERYEKLDQEDSFKDWISRMPILSITFAGTYMFIGLSLSSQSDLPEFNIYNSEYDDRIFDEGKNEYEMFYNFIKRKFIEIKAEMEEFNSIEL